MSISSNHGVVSTRDLRSFQGSEAPKSGSFRTSYDLAKFLYNKPSHSQGYVDLATAISMVQPDSNGNITLSVSEIIVDILKYVHVKTSGHEFKIPEEIVNECVINKQIYVKLIKNQNDDVIGYQVLNKSNNPAFTLSIGNDNTFNLIQHNHELKTSDTNIIYRGDTLNGKAHGNGCYICENSNQFSGRFEDGQLVLNVFMDNLTKTLDIDTIISNQQYIFKIIDIQTDKIQKAEFAELLVINFIEKGLIYYEFALSIFDHFVDQLNSKQIDNIILKFIKNGFDHLPLMALKVIASKLDQDSVNTITYNTLIHIIEHYATQTNNLKNNLGSFRYVAQILTIINRELNKQNPDQKIIKMKLTKSQLFNLAFEVLNIVNSSGFYNSYAAEALENVVALLETVIKTSGKLTLEEQYKLKSISDMISKITERDQYANRTLETVNRILGHTTT